MRHGFVRCAAGTPEIKVGDCRYNAGSIIEIIRRASEEEVRLLVLPELCITGYTCGELFLQQKLLEAAVEGLKEIAAATEGLHMVVVAGLPLSNTGKLYNCAAVIYEGEILGVVPKSYLPNYGEFYEARHFSPAPNENSYVYIDGKQYPFGNRLIFECKGMPQFAFGVEICEDLWAAVPPSCGLCAEGATIVANLSASNEVIGKEDYRRRLVTSQSAKLVCGYVYASAGKGESTTDLVFSGHNLIAENGALLEESPLFFSDLSISEIDVFRLEGERRRLRTVSSNGNGQHSCQRISFDMPAGDTKLTRTFARQPFVPDNTGELDKRCDTILNIQALGLVKRLEHTGSKYALVGISGGLDSCLALLVCAKAMDISGRSRRDIMAVTMPGFGTTGHTRNNAECLAEQIGATLKKVSISDSVMQHFKDIGHDPDDYSVVYENAQARERTQVLMDMANKFGGLMVGTGDLSELALGFTTYNGDHMSMYGVNASIPKTLVRHIVRYYADNTENEALKSVLYDILDTPVSPELLPAVDGEIAQRTESIIGPYELHDFFLYYAVRWAFPPSKTFRIAREAFRGTYSDEEILKWLRLFYRRFFDSQYKRSCMPDGPKVGTVALSPRGDWRMPSDASADEWLRDLDAY
jgi:NAD+ synthase (glutamine-hydrolysing)